LYYADKIKFSCRSRQLWKEINK